MRLNLCKVRRRSKNERAAVTDPADDIIVDESENELLVDEEADKALDNKTMVEMKTLNVEYCDENVLIVEHAKGGSIFPDEAPVFEKEEDVQDLEGSNKETSDEDEEGAHEKLVKVDGPKDGGNDHLSSLLKGVSLSPPEDDHGFTRGLSNLQDYCKNRLYDLMSNNDMSVKCVAEIVPSLAQRCFVGFAECKTSPLFVKQCLGIQDAAEKLEQECNEIRIGDDRVPLDMPTIPTGIWLVDSINEALDTWTDGEASQTMGNIFKLLNFTALLTYFGDSSGDKIANILSRTSSIVSRGPEAWREILRRMTTDGFSEEKPLPKIPNAKFASKCENKLDDVPDIDSVQCGEGPFTVYWLYTEKWLRKHFDPNFIISAKLLGRTREWFNSLESTSQELFIRLSRTLCCTRQ